jgi:hypothetical protein
MRYELFGVIDTCVSKYLVSSVDRVFVVKNSYSFDVGRIFISPAKTYGISGNDAIIRFNA